MKKYITTAKIIVLGVALSVGAGLVFAQWQDPTSSPFGGNTPAPINVGPDSQTKTGSFWADFLGSAGAGFIAGNFEVGNDIIIGGGTPAIGKILFSQDENGTGIWSDAQSFSCVRRSGTASASTVGVSCAPQEILTGGGGDCAGSPILYSRPHDTQARWELQCQQSGNIKATAICCLPTLSALDLSGGMGPI